jgi:hypothetical protein
MLESPGGACRLGLAGRENHIPITVWIEPKDDPRDDPISLGSAQPLPIDAAALQALEAEILAVFGKGSLITPDSVRGGSSTLEAAVLDRGWPTLDEARGKVMFVLLDSGLKREAYRAGAPSLQGRAMFTMSSAGQPDAAIISFDDVMAVRDLIPQLVKAGYLVRTFADLETVDARQNDTSRRDAAFASGAHYISTDFPETGGVAAGGYAARFPDGLLTRCNPLTASTGCASAIGELTAVR